jgi:type III restriction enzyme
MHREVNAIAGRLSLRPPQRRSLEILDRVTEIVPPKQGTDVETALEAIRSEYPSVTDFERDFPSLCFALATGVGKTRLMGAFISYLHLAHGIDNFFVLAPNLTIYNKLIADFTRNTRKYVFEGIGAFATQPPEIITGDNYESRAGTLFDELVRCKINIFNISKINTEVRGGKSPRIKRLSEYLGESYFEYLAALPDLVLLMDESHRYRATAGARAINELQPILGLELTATPYVSQGNTQTMFRNVVLDYPLRKAMEDGFVKEPAVVTRKDFSPDGMSPAELERLKLEDGIRLHEQTKVQLETFARQTANEIVKPFVLVIARDTTHAAELRDLIQSDAFFDGRYADKVIQVDSSGTGVERDEVIERLLKVEQRDEPTEIVIHVNMLKEGWDVTNLYTIVPLRAANARVLIEQTIGRGLRLPYGKRTGVAEVDRLSIVAHDRFQEIVDEANRPGSIIQMQTVVIDTDDLVERPRTVVSPPLIETMLGITPSHLTGSTTVETGGNPLLFATPAEQAVAQIAYRVLQQEQRNPEAVPDITYLERPDVQARIVAEVQAEYFAGQLGLDGVEQAVDVASVVQQTASTMAGQTISIPRIIVAPEGEVRSWFEPFELDLSGLNLPAVPSDELVSQALRTGDQIIIGTTTFSSREARLENYVVRGLVDFDDVSYEQNAELLQTLGEQVVDHLLSYLDEQEAEKVLIVHERRIADFVHSQMEAHYREDTGLLETKVNSGFTQMLPSAYTLTGDTRDFRVAPPDRQNIGRYLFGGFRKCLYAAQKFHSDTERMMAVILDRDAEKWFRPVGGQFQISYRFGGELPTYTPDFVAEFDDRIAMIETKRRSDLDDPEVLAKRDAAVEWCARAAEHTATFGGKPWVYALVPHDAVAENWGAAEMVDRWMVQVSAATA